MQPSIDAKASSSSRSQPESLRRFMFKGVSHGISMRGQTSVFVSDACYGGIYNRRIVRHGYDGVACTAGGFVWRVSNLSAMEVIGSGWWLLREEMEGAEVMDEGVGDTGARSDEDSWGADWSRDLDLGGLMAVDFAAPYVYPIFPVVTSREVCPHMPVALVQHRHHHHLPSHQELLVLYGRCFLVICIVQKHVAHHRSPRLRRLLQIQMQFYANPVHMHADNDDKANLEFI